MFSLAGLPQSVLLDVKKSSKDSSNVFVLVTSGVLSDVKLVVSNPLQSVFPVVTELATLQGVALVAACSASCRLQSCSAHSGAEQPVSVSTVFIVGRNASSDKHVDRLSVRFLLEEIWLVGCPVSEILSGRDTERKLLPHSFL
jgi:hypothetical protein